MNDRFSRHPATDERTGGRVRSWAKAHAPLGLIVVVMLAATMIPSAAALGGSGGTGTKLSDGNKYDRLWDGLSRKQHRWARRTSDCESGGDANIHGGGGDYHGAFQFMLSTWKGAPKSPGGDPHEKRWRVQGVVAVYLKK